MAIIDPKYLKFLQNLFKRNTTNDDHEAVITSMEHALETVNEDADLVKQELMLETADGDWLEDWGSWFNVSRLPGETDTHLRYRILTCMDDKVSLPAIKRGIKKIVGEDIEVSIYEPFVEIRYFNVSTFSGHGRYEDKDYYRIGVIDILVGCEITSELKRYVDTLRSAGIRAYITDNNLIKYTNFEENKSMWKSYNTTYGKLSFDDEWACLEAIEVGGNVGLCQSTNAYSENSLEPNTSYRLSFEGYSSSDVELNYIYVMSQVSGNYSLSSYKIKPLLTNIPQKFSFTFKTNTALTTIENISILLGYSNSSNTELGRKIYLRNIRLDKLDSESEIVAYYCEEDE